MKTKEELCALKEEVKELNKYRIFVLLRIRKESQNPEGEVYDYEKEQRGNHGEAAESPQVDR